MSETNPQHFAPHVGIVASPALNTLQGFSSVTGTWATLSAIGEFVAGVTHELNNPLTSVIGFAELLQQQSNVNERQRVTASDNERQRAATNANERPLLAPGS